MGSFILSSSAPSPLAVDVPAVSTLCVSESDMTSAALPRCVWICLNGLFSSTSLCAGSLERNAPWTQTLKHAMFMRRSRLCCVIEIAVKTPTHPVEGTAVQLSHPADLCTTCEINLPSPSLTIRSLGCTRFDCGIFKMSKSASIFSGMNGFRSNAEMRRLSVTNTTLSNTQQDAFLYSTVATFE